MHKKLTAIILTISLLLIPGCSNSRHSFDEVESKENVAVINFSSWISAEEVTYETIMDVEKKYMEDNPGIDINNIPISWEDTRNQLFSMIASNNTPDVAQIASPWFGQFYVTNELAPLEHISFSQYAKSVLDQYKKNNMLYALPWADISLAIFWNVKLLEKAGIDIDNLPRTYEEFNEVLVKISKLGLDKDGNRIYGFGIPNDINEITANIFNGFLKAQGGEFLDSFGKVAEDTGCIIKTLSWYRKLVDGSIVPKGLSFKDQYLLFVNDRMGGFLDATIGRNNLRLISGQGEEYDKNIVVSPVPLINGKSAVINNDHILIMFKNSKNKEEVEKFINYLCTDWEATLSYFKSTGTIPAATALLADKEYIKNEMVRPFIEQLPFKFNYEIGKTPYYTDAAECISTGVNMVTTGKMIPREGSEYIIEGLREIYK